VLYERVRHHVGPGVPVVAVLDLHANVTDRMTAALSALVAYRTNPHIDLAERGAEAARIMCRLIVDGPGVVAHVKLPFVPASTTLLTAPGQPYRALMDEAEEALHREQVQGGVLNISLCAGFAFADAPGCGFSVTVSALQPQAHAAKRLARALAGSVWSARHRFTPQLTPLDEAVASAVACGRGDGPRLILADVADNPGGGGGGNTVTLMRALHEAGARGVLVGVFCDPALAAEAHTRGVGAAFDATFNREPAPPWAATWTVRVRVLALGDGEFTGRRGLMSGTRASMGPTARLALEPTGQAREDLPSPGDCRVGLDVVVISQRQQLLDPAQLDGLGLDLDAQVRTLVVKSRGHFRAAFSDFAPPQRILEVDAPGLTTPNLRHLPWRRMPRPVHPIDDGVPWPDGYSDDKGDGDNDDREVDR
jgi:microcystin degradation protein MlrC